MVWVNDCIFDKTMAYSNSIFLEIPGAVGILHIYRKSAPNQSDESWELPLPKNVFVAVYFLKLENYNLDMEIIF